jgi:acetyltransferase-like isoleucine patch superfamily enzyme
VGQIADEKYSSYGRLLMFCTASLYPGYDIGKHTYGEVIIHGGSKDYIKIGDYCSIAGNLQLQCGGDHYMDFISTYPFPNIGKWTGYENWRPYKNRHDASITIGNDVWIGLDVMVRHGVTIGDGAVIGMRSLVINDIPPYAIAAGNPAKVLRYRFTPEQIESLLKIKWWNWSEEEINKAIPYMDNIEEFIARYEKAQC